MACWAALFSSVLSSFNCCQAFFRSRCLFLSACFCFLDSCLSRSSKALLMLALSCSSFCRYAPSISLCLASSCPAKYSSQARLISFNNCASFAAASFWAFLVVSALGTVPIPLSLSSTVSVSSFSVSTLSPARESPLAKASSALGCSAACSVEVRSLLVSVPGLASSLAVLSGTCPCSNIVCISQSVC